MKSWRLFRALILPTVFLALNAPALACSVCFGDSESPMAKGVVAGVLLLAGIISFVLMGVAGTGLFWVHRSRRLARGQADGSEREW